MFAYHVVTERPMYVGQQILFDSEHHSGVYQRVMARLDVVNNIYSSPANYDPDTLEHHTSVALRELALEEVRLEKYPRYLSRMGCLYVSRTVEEAEKWAQFFSDLGRPTYSIVRLEINGNCFAGDATRCFKGQLQKKDNLKLAEAYWAHPFDEGNPQAICEMLVDGQITVLEIIKKINANIENR